MENKLPEYWIRGPIEGFSPFTNPIAAGLLQVLEEVSLLIQDFPDERLWERPFGRASVGFHLNHMAGVLDRLFTYARGEKLSPEQLDILQKEGIPSDHSKSSKRMVEALDIEVNKCLLQLKSTQDSELTQIRTVGRMALPSTVIGLFVHATEHNNRHLGQLLVTISALKETKI